MLKLIQDILLKAQLTLLRTCNIETTRLLELNLQLKVDEFERNLTALRWPFKQASARAY
jgi:hypothetical protein